MVVMAKTDIDDVSLPDIVRADNLKEDYLTFLTQKIEDEPSLDRHQGSKATSERFEQAQKPQELLSRI